MYLYGVKRITVILLLSAYLLSVTELGQLLRISVLVEHYAEHRNSDPDLSFFGFLTLHYSKQEQKSKQDHRDQQLPFKTIQSQLLFINEFIPDDGNLILLCHSSEASGDLPWYHNPDTGTESLSSIWQPPKTFLTI